MIEEIKSHLNSVAADIGGRIENIDRRVTEVEKASKRVFHGGPRVEVSEETAAMKTWARSGLVEKALSVTHDGQGVSVRSDWAARIYELIRESSPLRQVASVLQTSSDSIEILVDRGEPDSEWTDELSTRNVTDASFLTRHKIPVSEHFALPEVTLQLLEDSQFDAERWLQEKIAQKFARAEATAFVRGDGVNKPRGLLDYPTVPDSVFGWGSDPTAYELGAVYSGVPGDVGDPNTGLDAIFRLVDSLKASYLPRASFLMTRKFRGLIRLMKDAEGRSLFQPSLDGAIPDRLLGFPIYLAEDLDPPDVDTIGCYFGDFSQGYTIADRTGISIQRDSLTKPGFVRYYARRRVGGQVSNPEAIKCLVLGNDPIVTT
jgi:HK97 family phage major capsid protein